MLAHHGNMMSSEVSHILKRKSWGEREREKEREREEEEAQMQLRKASAKVFINLLSFLFIHNFHKLTLFKKFWDLSTVKCIETLKGHHDNVGALCLVEGILYSASADGSIKVYFYLLIIAIMVLFIHF